MRRYFVSGHGYDISLTATIGGGLRLPHAIGVVIGAGTVIGNNVSLYHNVTLGRKTDDNIPCPTVEDGAAIYTGSVVLGGVRIGKGAIVGANSVVLKSVADGARVAGAPAKTIPATPESV